MTGVLAALMLAAAVTALAVLAVAAVLAKMNGNDDFDGKAW